MPGVCAKRVQMLGPAPSASGEPSIWCAAVAAPQRNPFGNEYSCCCTCAIDNDSPCWSVVGMKTITCQNTGTNRTSVMSGRSEEHTSELQSLMRTSYAVFCLKKKNN